MKTSRSLLWFILLALQDGKFGRVKAKLSVRVGEEGGDITVACSFSLSGSTKLFCRETCYGGKILIETTENKAHRGRYSIEYQSNSFHSPNVLSVTIKRLEKSDSGWYRCALENYFYPASTWDFEIQVRGVSTPPPPTGFVWPLALGVTLVVILVFVVSMLVYKKKNCVCMNRRKTAAHNMTESAVYVNSPPVPPSEDPVYQSLNSDSRDPNQVYCTLVQTQQHT